MINKTDEFDKYEEMNEFDEPNKHNKLNEFFKLPIYYNNSKISLKQNIVDDLELTNTIDMSSNPIYTYGFNNDNDLSTAIIRQIWR